LAFDKAGNPRTLERTFEVYADTTSTIADVERAFTLGWITKKTVKNDLVDALKTIMKLEKKIFKLQSKLPQQAPGKVSASQKAEKQIEKLAGVIDKKLGKDFLSDLEKKLKSKTITQEAYDLLSEDVAAMMQ
jgi:hypothetical protein